MNLIPVNTCWYFTPPPCRQFAWDIFDIDSLSWLSVDEMDALIRMVYNSECANPVSMAKIREASTEGGMSFDTFSSLLATHPNILTPAFNVRLSVRGKLFGEKYWEERCRMRTNLYGLKHIPRGTPWEDVTAYLSFQNNGKGLVRNNVEGNRQREAAIEESTVLVSTQPTEKASSRKNDSTPEEPLITLPEERREGRLKRRLSEVVSQITQDCTADEIDSRKALRQHLWNLIDELEDAGYSMLDAQEDRDFDLRGMDFSDVDCCLEGPSKRKVCFPKKGLFKKWAKRSPHQPQSEDKQSLLTKVC